MYYLFFILFFLNQSNDIKIENAWIRNASKGMTTACFMEIINNSDKSDTLYNVFSNIAKKVEIHETYTNGDMMGMRRIDYIVIEPKSKFTLKPKSYHIMLINLKKDLKENKEENLTLYFKNAGELKIKAKVKKMSM